MIFLDIGETAACVRWDEADLFRYIFNPDDPRLESPRPYFHPVRTLGGNVVTVYRPHDHVWHKGIAWSLPNVGPHNFWGGVTFRRGDGYIQLPNNGTMRHDGFDIGCAKDDLARLTERLTWLAESGPEVIEEARRIAVTAWPEDGAWLLRFESSMRNVTAQTLPIGSPTTEGRPNAGYGGLFWRGPRSFTGGVVITPEGTGGDEVMGRRAPWLGFAGQHDGRGGWSTLVFRDDPGRSGQWFVRSTPFGAVCPAPFFDSVYPLEAGATLTLSYDVVVADGELGPRDCGRLAGRAAGTAADFGSSA
jgi:hypothetical protein